MKTLDFRGRTKAPYVFAAVIYCIIFLVFFISFPLNHSLPSDLDSWYYIAYFNHYSNVISNFIFETPQTSFFYPDRFPSLNGEPSYSLYGLWLPFKLLTQSDLWSYFFVFISVYIMNAMAVFTLVKSYFPSIRSKTAFICGLLFNLNMFMFANLDNLNTLIWGPGILAFVYFRKLLDNKTQNKLLVLAISLLTLFQLSASVYNFLYTAILIGIFSLFHFKLIFPKLLKDKWNSVIVFSALLVAVAYIYFIVFYSPKPNHWNFSQSLESLNYVSIKFRDFCRVLPFTLYGDGAKGYLYTWGQYKSFFLGFTFLLFGLAGLFIRLKERKFLFTLIFVSLIIGLGAFIDVFGTRIMLPLGFLFEKFEWYGFYRFPYRIALIMLLIWVIFVGNFLHYLEARLSKNKFSLLLAGFTFFVLIENIPFKRNYFKFDIYHQEGLRLRDNFSDEPSANVLILPVTDFINNGADPNIYRSEHIYMYWQTLFKQNMINGQSGHSPPHIQELIASLFYTENVQESFGAYLKKYKITHILYYGNSWGFMDTNLDFQQLERIAAEEQVSFQFIE